jgi:NAD(P)-dependent dehydrogenase (short-subunit alcohol dehydrogenase family)
MAPTLDAIARVGGRVMAVLANVTDLAEMRAAVATIEAQLRSLSLAVNAAGIANAAPAEEMDLTQWQRMYDIDITGVFISCQVEGQTMLAHGRGAIVDIVSMSGTIANRGLTQAHYNSAKAAVIHLSKSLAAEWATRGVRVNSLSPGYTMTPMNTRPEVAEQVPSLRLRRPCNAPPNPKKWWGQPSFCCHQPPRFVLATI